ncbi:hypothetical protein Ciccas_008017 [Cichlidogyrus casuarinus]|uniref:PH domain-containing protein n=1 Tax=Cichlidogyrus casuarinus TaxID=1844966 RepID=A0ABD2Q3S3_9PLAT
MVCFGSYSWSSLLLHCEFLTFIDHINRQSKEKITKGERRGCVKLKSAQIGIDNEDDSTFTITVDHKTFHFQAQNADERQRWLDALQEVRDHHTHTNSFIQTQTKNLHIVDNSLADFERRIVEADVYLRLLVEQHHVRFFNLLYLLCLKALVQQSKQIGHNSQISDLLAKLIGIIENVKHTISCLQKAKENALAVVPTNHSNMNQSVDHGKHPSFQFTGWFLA